MKYDVRLVNLFKTIDYATAKALQAPLQARYDAASIVLKAECGTERGPMGLLPDHVKARPSWKAANAEFNAAQDALGRFNGPFFRQFKKELNADRIARRIAMGDGRYTAVA